MNETLVNEPPLSTTTSHDGNDITYQLLFSKLLGYSILVLTSLFVRLPQLVKIVRAKSSDGVNYSSETLLSVVATNGVCYNIANGYPISTWGESAALSLQGMAIGWCILTYSKRPLAAAVHVVIFVTYSAVMLAPTVPMSVHVTLQLLAIPMISSAKLVQIRTNWSRRSTGLLSTTAITAQTIRTASRFLTHVIETGDVNLIAVYLISTFLNFTLLAQLFIYRKVTGPASSTDRDVKTK